MGAEVVVGTRGDKSQVRVEHGSTPGLFIAAHSIWRIPLYVRVVATTPMQTISRLQVNIYLMRDWPDPGVDDVQKR